MFTKGQIFWVFDRPYMQLFIGLLLTWTLNVTPFSRYSMFKSSEYDTDCSCPPKVKYFEFSKGHICNFLLDFCWHELSMLHCSRDILYSRVLIMALTIRVHRRWNILSFQMTTCNFILVFCWHLISNLHRIQKIPTFKIEINDLNTSGSLRVKYFKYLR